MARGARAGNDNGLAMIAGAVAAAILDYGWNTSHFYGYNQILGVIKSKNGKQIPITTADYAQIGFSSILGAYGFLRAGPNSRIPAFAFGMSMTQIITKFLFATSGIPRYIAFDVDSQGRLVPTGQFQ